MAVGLFTTAPGCDPEPPSWGSSEEAITNGRLEVAHPEVGLLRLGAEICTATLVGRRTVITAAHCLLPGSLPNILIRGKAYPAEQATAHPGWDAKSLANDLGLVRLASEPNVPAATVGTSPPRRGTRLRLIGFGSTADRRADALTKREALNQVAELEPTRFTVAGSGSEIGNICHGDSGGPALDEAAEELRVVGVASAGLRPCGTLGYFTRVDVYAAWLDTVSGGDVEHSADPSADPAAPGAALTAEQPELLAARTGQGCQLSPGPPRGLLGLLLSALAAASLLGFRRRR